MKAKILLVVLMSIFFPLVFSTAQNLPVDTVILQHKSDIPFAGIGLPQKTCQDQEGRPFCYVAAKEGGLRIFDISDIEHPILVKLLATDQFSNQEVMNLWQEGMYLYVALGNFFGGTNPPGIAIVDVSMPDTAFVTDVWIGEMAAKGSAFVTVSGDYAYLGAMSQGLIILSVADKNDISFVAQYIPDIDFPLQNPNSIQLPNARGMQVRADTVWLCYDAGGLRLIDVSDKLHPYEAAHYINLNALGKQQAYNNIVLDGSKAYIAVDFCGLEILDISDPGTISEIAWWNPWDCQSQDNTWLNSPGHSNQIVLDTSKGLVFLSTGRSELNIIDVTEPALLRQVGSYGLPDDNYFAWGVSVYGERVYLSYISSFFPFFSIWSGVKIFDWDAVTATSDIDESLEVHLFPNPFHQSLFLDYNLKRATSVLIEMRTIHGNLVGKYPQQIMGAGKHSWEWQSNVSPGCYILRMTTDTGSSSRKIICTAN